MTHGLRAFLLGAALAIILAVLYRAVLYGPTSWSMFFAGVVLVIAFAVKAPSKASPQ